MCRGVLDATAPAYNHRQPLQLRLVGNAATLDWTLSFDINADVINFIVFINFTVQYIGEDTSYSFTLASSSQGLLLLTFSHFRPHPTILQSYLDKTAYLVSSSNNWCMFCINNFGTSGLHRLHGATDYLSIDADRQLPSSPIITKQRAPRLCNRLHPYAPTVSFARRTLTYY